MRSIEYVLTEKEIAEIKEKLQQQKKELFQFLPSTLDDYLEYSGDLNWLNFVGERLDGIVFHENDIAEEYIKNKYEDIENQDMEMNDLIEKHSLRDMQHDIVQAVQDIFE